MAEWTKPYVWTRNDRADHDAGHPSGWDCDGDALTGPHETCANRFPADPTPRADVALTEDAAIDSLRSAHAQGPDCYLPEGWHAAVGRLLAAHDRDAARTAALHGDRDIWQAMARRLIAEAEAAEAERDQLRAVLTEWGVLAQDGDFVDDDDFAEAIRDSGAWRLARDLRAALTTPPTTEGNDS